MARELQLVRGEEVDWSPRLALMVRETDPELFTHLFGPDNALWERLFAVEWYEADGLHARTCTELLTEKGGTILGLVNSFPAAETEVRAAASFGRYMGSVEQPEAARLAMAGEDMGYLFPPAAKEALVLFNIVVVQAARGLGCGARLIRAAENRAMRLGLASIHLDVAVSNPAVSFYERMGFAPVVRTELVAPGTEAIPPHLRMVKPILAGATEDPRM